MSATQFTDEELMAFADGALPEPRFSEIAAALERDGELTGRIEELALGGRAARAVFAPLAEQPVPEALRRNIETAIAEEGPAKILPLAPKRRPSILVPMAIAASIAVILAGPLAFLLGQSTAPSSLLAMGEPLAPPLLAEITRLPSGGEAMVADATRLRAIASFTDSENRLCREFELHGAQGQLAVACRENGDWRLAIAIDIPPEGEGYAPAAALDVLDAFLLELGASPPLSPEAETQALAGR